jgi:hypothetical protein
MRSFLMLALVSWAASAEAKELQTVWRTFSVADARAARIEFPAGDLTITATDTDSVLAIMTAHCSGSLTACAERAENIRLVSRTSGSTFHLELEGMPKTNKRGLSVELEIEIPRSLTMVVDMGAGDLAVRGAEHDVELHLGAGNVRVNMRERAVRSVRAHVGVGDADLRSPHGSVPGAGFLSKSLRWSDGTGTARIRVDLGVGDVDVRLE